MIPRPLHYSHRSSSAVQINYHWCSINGSFQISPRRMPLICSRCLSRVERSATVPLPAICEDEKLPTVLAHFPSMGGSPIMTDVNYCGSRPDLSQVAHFAFFYALLTGYVPMGEGYSYKVVLLSEIVDDKLRPLPS